MALLGRFYFTSPPPHTPLLVWWSFDVATLLGYSPQLSNETLRWVLPWWYFVDRIKDHNQLILKTILDNLGGPDLMSWKTLRAELRLSWRGRNSDFGQQFLLMSQSPDCLPDCFVYRFWTGVVSPYNHINQFCAINLLI